MTESLSATRLSAVVADACRRISPVWPLDQSIAVNPWWGRIDQAFEPALADLARLWGATPYLSHADYRAAMQQGCFGAEDLHRAMQERGLHTLPEWGAPPQPLPLLCDLRDRRHLPPEAAHWREAITRQISRFCAVWFDVDPVDAPATAGRSLYADWRAARGGGADVQRLPADADTMLAWGLARLDLPADAWNDYLDALLGTVHGWAAWCAWLERHTPAAPALLRELLAIRLGWECLCDDGARGPDSAWQRWRQRMRDHRAPDLRAPALWQRALELGLHASLARRLAHAPHPPQAPDAQLVFCIDVRSEPMRRALEQADPGLHTLGFAGFFGLPAQFQPLGLAHAQPHLPGLLTPTLQIGERSGDAVSDARLARLRQRRLTARRAREPFWRLPGSAFTRVEALGLGYLVGLLRQGRGIETSAPGLRAAEARTLAPQVLRQDPVELAALAGRILRGMSLTQGFAPLVVLVGHGASCRNNPQSAALECGACGGQSGEVSARALAELLNREAVRAALRQHQGIDIPSGTRFAAARHDTTTASLTLWTDAVLEASQGPRLARLRQAARRAGHALRAARAEAAGLAHLAARPDALERAVRARAEHWAEPRPEAGLAGNAALIIAPRARSRGLDLEGAAFLHEYCAAQDADGQVLESILTAPLMVAHWINLQYYASTVDNLRFGSGNKTLHNVVGGTIGVFEGNGGDLRIGLARQSLVDGTRRLHWPRRLAVFVEAPRGAIERALARHATLRRLVQGAWLFLWRIEPGGTTLEVWREGGWARAAPDSGRGQPPFLQGEEPASEHGVQQG